MKLVEFLDSKGIRYEMSQHRPTFTAQQMAAEEHITGMAVAKPVLVRADGKYYMCVLPACCKIDMDALKNDLRAGDVALADEEEMSGMFEDCALGAEPPFGNLYGMETLLDSTLEKDPKILFQAGTHELAIKMGMSDYKKLAHPKVMKFSYHMH